MSLSKVFLEVMNSVLMTGEIPGLFAKDEMMAMTADLRNSFLKVGRVKFQEFAAELMCQRCRTRSPLATPELCADWASFSSGMI